MEIPKPTSQDRDRFHALVPPDERVQVKPMFGNLGADVNGNTFMGLFGPDVGLKLPVPDAQRLRQVGGGPFGPPQRPMSGCTTLTETLWDDRGQAQAWVGLALEHVAQLPPKMPKPPRAKKPREAR